MRGSAAAEERCRRAVRGCGPPSPGLPGEEEGVDAAAQLLADLQQSHLLPRASGALHLQVLAIEEVIALKTLDGQVVHWMDVHTYIQYANYDTLQEWT